MSLQVQYFMFEFLRQILPVKTQILFSIFLFRDLYFFFVTSIIENFMPQNFDQNLAKLVFGFEVFNFLTALKDRFAISLHVLDGVEFFDIFSTVHQELIESLWKLYVAEIETDGIKKLATIGCKYNRIKDILR